MNQFAGIRRLASDARRDERLRSRSTVRSPMLCKKYLSIDLLNFVCGDLALNSEQVVTITQKRGKVDAFHNSLKSNASLAKSPTRRVRTKSNSVFLSIVAVFKLKIPNRNKAENESHCHSYGTLHQSNSVSVSQP